MVSFIDDDQLEIGEIEGALEFVHPSSMAESLVRGYDSRHISLSDRYHGTHTSSRRVALCVLRSCPISGLYRP
jgi:hypothetical protein